MQAPKGVKNYKEKWKVVARNPREGVLQNLKKERKKHH